jgi:glycosyltransferase involved in cell wall biosynthesis
MLFSILIAHYNNARFLQTAIESVLCQTYTNWEIVFVDDGSTDHFETILETYKDDQRIKIFRNEKNHGCGYTKRKCAELASGELMGFLDPDDKLHPKALATMADAHQRFPTHSIVHSTHYICDENLGIKRVSDYVKPLPLHTPYLLVSDGRIHHFASFKSSCYKKTEGISAEIKKAVDQDLYYKLEETGAVLLVNEPMYYYRLHKGSISNFGKESETSIVHYSIIREACKRRIKKLKAEENPNREWARKYHSRYFKMSIFYWSRKKNWLLMLYYLFLFPFNGGSGNIVSYLQKIPREGKVLLRKTFVTDYEIR